jgi:hypothetical protein
VFGWGWKIGTDTAICCTCVCVCVYERESFSSMKIVGVYGRIFSACGSSEPK